MPEKGETIMNGQAISLGEMRLAAAELLGKCSVFRVWFFFGEIGAGKTTLIKTICELLGVKAGMSSPTFSIVNEYETDNGEPIYHFDFYRLKNEKEAYDLGAEEYFDSGNYCFVEWPEKAPSLAPAHFVTVHITTNDPNYRTIAYASHE